MLKVHDYAALAEVASADLDAWQEKTVGARPSSTASEFTTTMVGADRLHIQLNASWTNATVKTFDTSIDWRDRQLSGSCAILSGSSQRLGQADDDDCNDPISTTVHICEFIDQYTGRGAYSDVATSAAVSNGNLPINGAGAVRSCAPVIADIGSGYVYLYADPTDGSLKGYNNHGAGVYLRIVIEGTGPTGLRP